MNKSLNKKGIILGSILLLLAIGFAAVSTTLLINGNLLVGENKEDFKIYFSQVKENNVSKDELIKNDAKTEIEFDVTLTDVGQTYVLDYEITNNSRNYDGEFTVVFEGEDNDYYSIKNEIDSDTILKAQEKRWGKITIELKKPYNGDEYLEFNVSYSIIFNAVERDTLGIVYNPEIIKLATGWCHGGNTGCSIEDYETNSVWNEYNAFNPKASVEKITIKNNNEVPANAIKSWDASEKQNGSIMGYSLDEDNDGLVELYLGGNGGVIANENSHQLFYHFTDVTEIEGLEYLDTSNVTDMSWMFANCTSLTTLDVSNFDTSNVTDMSWMFVNCTSLTTLDLSSFDTSNVTDMSWMFDGCSNLTTLDVSNFDNVTDMHGMFYNCSSLTTLDLSSFDTSNVTDMGSMFSYCSSLTTLDLSSFDTSNVTNMSSMFKNCSSLTTLDISNFDTSNVTDMSWMFSYCSRLTTELYITGKDKKFSGMFFGTSIILGRVVINYSSDKYNLAVRMINTKSSDSNVILGLAPKVIIENEETTLVLPNY